MDYFTAVQEGRARVKKALDILQETAGQCYPMLFLKLGTTDWTPVGTEMLYAVVPGKDDMAALVICDAEGNSKAMSTWVPDAKGQELASALATKGLERFDGEVKLPV